MCRGCVECARMLDKTTKTSDGCLEYTVHPNRRTGRAYFQLHNKRFIAARWLWQHMNRELHDGECVLHVCDNNKCVNIQHLFIGSQLENIRDRDCKGRNRLLQTHCKNGHLLSKDNVRLFGPMKKWRACKCCLREGMRRYRLRTGKENHT